MAEKVKLSKDGNSIDFVQSDNIPTSLKKFRQSPEIEGFYRFIFENDLQKEAYEILDRIVQSRKASKKAQKTEAQQAKKAEAQIVKAAHKASLKTQALPPVAAKLTTKSNEKNSPANSKQSIKQPTKLTAKPAVKAASAKAVAKPATKSNVKQTAKQTTKVNQKSKGKK